MFIFIPIWISGQLSGPPLIHTTHQNSPQNSCPFFSPFTPDILVTSVHLSEFKNLTSFCCLFIMFLYILHLLEIVFFFWLISLNVISTAIPVATKDKIFIFYSFFWNFRVFHLYIPAMSLSTHEVEYFCCLVLTILNSVAVNT